VDISRYSTKDIGNLGEKVAAEYLRRHGFKILDKNVVRKTGEIDIIARNGEVLHFIEVKARLCEEFPVEEENEGYDPADNLHEHKVRKVARTGEWYVAEKGWEGDWQVDGVLIWLRRRDGQAQVRYLPQIV